MIWPTLAESGEWEKRFSYSTPERLRLACRDAKCDAMKHLDKGIGDSHTVPLEDTYLAFKDFLCKAYKSLKTVQWRPRLSRQKVCFQNAIFKNLVWNYKAQSLHNWSKGSLHLPKVFKFSHCGSQFTPGVTTLHWIILVKVQTTSSLEPLIGI